MKKILIFAIVVMMLAGGLAGWKAQAEEAVCIAPDWEKADLTPIFQKRDWKDDDYRILFYQTGLSRRAIEGLPKEERKEKLLHAQEAFFKKPVIRCSKNSLITWQEENRSTLLPELVGLENGDILVSFCTHTYGWRNGHTAIVVDAENGKTLEAVLLGYDSCVQDVSKWRKYPAFIVLRLKDATSEERADIAAYALEHMEGIPYGFVTDVLEHFWWGDAKGGDTDCSHLIWKSFKEFGYDLDSDGGIIVTPRDIAESPLLEVIQVYGIDLESVRESDIMSVSEDGM